ncbi:MAG: hypothetical protein HGB00_02060 [Chlorobiaceae bacterium]|nr:hypothetical protein [Chlorobiaceae bacterium]
MAYFPHRRIDGPTVVTAGLSLFVLSYVTTRAAKLCITIDEAATYLCHVSGRWLDIILFRTDGLPDNNHLLYTLLCKLSVSLFGLSELPLRIPAILGCLFYLIGLNLCLRRIASGWKIVLGFLAVGLNPYVIDYLGLARGYGLGLGFTMLGLAALLASIDEITGKIRVITAQRSIILFGLAALSNLSFLLVLCAAMLLIGIVLAYSGFRDLRASELSGFQYPILLLKIMLPSVPVLVYLSLPIRLIRELKLFGEGGHNGFWADTVTGLIKGTAYASPKMWQNIDSMIGWVMIVSLFVPLAIAILRRRDKSKFIALSMLAGMTFIVSLASIAQHYLLHVAYLEGRRSIFLIPLFLLTAIAVGGPPRKAARWYVLTAMIIGLLVPSVLAAHNVASINLRFINDWNFNEGTRPAMLAIRKSVDMQKSDRQLKMRVNDDFAEVMNFYRIMLGMEETLLPIENDGLEGAASFYFGHNKDVATIARSGARPLLLHPASRTVLYERSGVDSQQ